MNGSRQQEEVPYASDGCCYRAVISGGAEIDPQDLNAVLRRLLKPLKFLKWFPAKVGITVEIVLVTRVETGESHHYLFVGVGPGAGLSITKHVWGEGPMVCCPATECPTFDDFEGVGRLTLLSVVAGVGVTWAFLDFPENTNCRLYFQNHLTGDVGLGASIGTYIGYYKRLD